MAEKNGNGNGRNGKSAPPSAVSLATLISLAVLILGMVGFWWNQADPRQSLADIRTSIGDLRKEHVEAIAEVYKHLSEKQVTLREHNDLNARTSLQDDQLNRKIDDVVKAFDKKIDAVIATETANHSLSLTKAQFEAWNIERNLYIQSIQKRIDVLDLAMDNVEKTRVTRSEYDQRWASFTKSDDAINHRIDIVSERLDKFRETVDRMDTPLSKLVLGMNDRITAMGELVMKSRFQVEENTEHFKRNEELIRQVNEKVDRLLARIEETRVARGGK